MTNREDEIQLPLNPYDGLSVTLIDTLEALVLRAPSWEDADRAIDALEFLVEELDSVDLDDPDEVREWIADNRGEDLYIYLDDAGVQTRAKSRRIEVLIPAAIVDIIIREVIESASRHERLEGIRDLVAEWGALITDDEKMVGHLVLSHEHSIDELHGRTTDPEGLRLLHASLHPGPDVDPLGGGEWRSED